MLRDTTPADKSVLVELARATEVFYPHEIETLGEVIDDYFATEQEAGQVMQTWEIDGVPVGFVHYCPVAMTLGTWELWWIVVAADRQGQGLGRKLLRAAEEGVRDRGGRNLFIETSSTAPYEPTRQFYLRCGYTEVARLPGFYHDSDDKVVFHRLLETR